MRLWASLILLAWILLELTAQPALAVAMICVKFGCEDFLTARWLRQRDPDHARGRVCFLMYLAHGLWKASALASFLMMLVGVFMVLLLIRQKPAAGVFAALGMHGLGALCTFALGVLASGLSAFTGAQVARRNGVWMWVDEAVYTARQNDQWPPPDGPAGRKNEAPQLIELAWTTIGLVVLLIGAVIGYYLHPLAQQDDLAFTVLMFTSAAIPLLALTIFLIGAYWAAKQNIACFPSDCWNRRSVLAGTDHASLTTDHSP